MTERGIPPGWRGVRLADAPTRSVVVASLGSREQLAAALETLRAACRPSGVEIVVARSCPTTELGELQAAFPDVLFIPVADGSTPRQTRAVGLTAADGDVAHLLDDTRPVSQVWLDHVTRPWPGAAQGAAGAGPAAPGA